MTRRRDERGSTIPLIVGLASVLIVAIAVVVNASSAYLQRQALDTLADGAALRGADLGAAGVYAEGVPADRLLQHAQAVTRAVRAYLAAAGAYDDYAWIDVAARVDPVTRSVTVTLSAPADLPLGVPGTPRHPVVGASSTAAVTVLP